MFISRITIEFQADPADTSGQYTSATFENGAWTFIGDPIYSRFLPALHEVWQVLRRAVKGDGQ